jgi:hypothetical protein
MRSVRSFRAAIGALALTLVLPTPARAELPEEPDEPEPPGTPRVYIDSIDPHVILFRVPTPNERADLGPTYRGRGIPLCRAPCGRWIDARDGRLFYLERPSIHFSESDRFKLDEYGGNVTVRLGDRRLYRTGLGFTVAGALTLGAGAALAVASFFQYVGSGAKDFGSLEQARADVHTANLLLWSAQGLGIGGLGMLIGGLVTLNASKIGVQVIPLKASPSAVRLDGLTLRF